MTDTLHHFNQEFQHGNLKLFNQLFTDYYLNLCRFAYTFVKDTIISEEIVLPPGAIIHGSEIKMIQINSSQPIK
jgi:hypothetical protein